MNTQRFLFVIALCTIACEGASMSKLKLRVFVADTLEGKMYNFSSPVNSVSSCYVTSQSGISTQTCATAADDCLKVTFNVVDQGVSIPGQGLACTLAEFCDGEGAEAVCAEVKQQFKGYEVTDCKVTCCSTDNCNKPEPSFIVSMDGLL